MQETQIKTDVFKYLYLQQKNKVIPEEEKMNRNLTTPFFEIWIPDKIQANELINMTIRGVVREGKSTVAATIMAYINQQIKKIKKNEAPTIEKNNLNQCIVSDQLEFTRLISQKMKHICIQIDEFNKMAETGVNATTEQALFAYYSDVFAANYVHRILCTPSAIVDANCSIYLEVIGRDLETKTTRLKLMF